MNTPNKKAGLYIHVPFCSNKCNYCDFYSLVASDSVKAEYVDALTRHIMQKSRECADMLFDSVYVGGGTPTALGSELLVKVLSAVTASFNLDSDTEFTVETNPGLCEASDFRALRVLGANRLSIGLQSANEDELATLGRIHTLSDYARTVSSARDADFGNISTDIMFSLPSQTYDKLARTLEYAVSASPEHISAYSLKIEPGTPFHKMRSSLAIPNEDTDADMYLQICDTLSAAGYAHYEISNFAKQGRESRHNLKYWRGDDYIGFGPGAHSFLKGTRYAYARDIKSYIDVFTSGKDESGILSEKYAVDENEAIRERLMLGLRLADGVGDKLLEKFAPLDEMYARLSPLMKAGLVTKSPEGIALTNRGMYVSNSIINLIYG